MELVTPGIGLIFWMLLSFGILLVILKKFAWKPILQSLKNRENSISNALNNAEKARKEFEQLQKENQEIMANAKVERDKIFADAQNVREKIITEAKVQATAEAKKLIEAARKSIENEKIAAIDLIRKEIGLLSVDIAEKVLKQKLQDDQLNKKIIEESLKDITFN